MKKLLSSSALMAGCVCLLSAGSVMAQDWPQWRGANRDGKASGFQAPQAWPKELRQQWKVTVGRGDATPVLMEDKLYVFARDGGSEVTLCLDAGTGKELWRDKFDSLDATGPSAQHSGPRSSPSALGNEKLVTYGVRGTLSCLQRASGKVVWRKDDFSGTWPRFFTASSPLVGNGLCFAQLGGEEKGGIVAYDLASGEQKWKWTQDGTAYSSPTFLVVGGTEMLLAMTSKRIVGLNLADGKLLWETPFAPQGRAYNAATPIVSGQTVIFAGSGRGAKAVQIEKKDAGFTVKELWSNPDNGVQFNSPVLKGEQIYGISQNGLLFCLDAREGKTLWTSNLGGRGFGSIVDAGSVLLALTPQGDLTVFAASDKEYKQLASYKVGADTYAYPIAAGNKLYVKDKESVTLWSLE